MEAISESVVEHGQHSASQKADICPFLILTDTIHCDALKLLYQPNDRQVRECCLNEYYSQCSLLRPAA